MILMEFGHKSRKNAVTPKENTDHKYFKDETLYLHKHGIESNLLRIPTKLL